MRRLAVAVHDLGGTQGPLLLLLHANGFHGRTFLPMLPVFAPHFHCVALDLPGHGVAPTPDAPFTAEELLAAVLDYVESSGIQDCYCFGHSLGGAMAALLQLARPKTFRGMFLFEPVIRPFLDLSQGLPDRPDGSHSVSGTGAAETGVAGHRLPVSGCGPSPSLVDRPAGRRPDSVLARIARKRQSAFPSLAGAKASLGSKPPFSTFHLQALHAYLACGGLRPLDGWPPVTAASGAAAEGRGCLDAADGCLGAAAAAAPLTLACTTENEARVYEALDPPPWRPWQQLTAAAAATDATVAVASSGDGGCGGCVDQQQNQHDGPVGPRSTGCRLAIAVGREEGLHARLARWGAQVAELVPGAELFRFASLNHLGPMEDPVGVARAALGFLLGGSTGCDDVAVDSSTTCGTAASVRCADVAVAHAEGRLGTAPPEAAGARCKL